MTQIKTWKLSTYLPDLCMLQGQELIITSNIMAYLDRNNLLFQNQHGFRSRLSCET